MAPFRAKIGLRRPRKGENRNYRFVPFLPDALQKIPKKQEKNYEKKKKKYSNGFISRQNQLKEDEKERK